MLTRVVLLDLQEVFLRVRSYLNDILRPNMAFY